MFPNPIRTAGYDNNASSAGSSSQSSGTNLEVQAVSNRPALPSLQTLAARQSGAILTAQARFYAEDNSRSKGKVFNVFNDSVYLFDQARTDPNTPIGEAPISQMLLDYVAGEKVPYDEKALACYLRALDKIRKNKPYLRPTQQNSFTSLAKQQDDNGRSLFYLTVSKGMTELTEWLLKQTSPSFSVNAPFTGDNDEKKRPLHMAVEKGDKNMVDLLVKNGADVDVQDYSGCSLLNDAVMRSDESMVDLLVKNGADVNLQSNGLSPLYYAVMRSEESIVCLLVDKGADVNIKDYYGTLLNCAVRYNESMASLLVEKGADVNLQDNSGQSPLFCAAQAGNESMVRWLVDKGADVNHQDGSGNPPLSVLAEKHYENTGLASFFVEKGADVNPQTCLLYTSPSPRDRQKSRMPSSA